MTCWPPTVAQALHLAGAVDQDLVEAAMEAGGATFVVDISELDSKADVLDTFNRTFTLPYPATNVDAAIDLYTDPLTDEVKPGYVVTVTGCDAAREHDVLSIVAGMAPSIAERSRTIDIPYVWMFVSTLTQDVVLTAAREANARLEKAAASDSWPFANSGAIPLFVDGVEVSAT